MKSSIIDRAIEQTRLVEETDRSGFLNSSRQQGGFTEIGVGTKVLFIFTVRTTY